MTDQSEPMDIDDEPTVAETSESIIRESRDHNRDTGKFN